MVLCATLGLGLIAWALSSAVLSGVVRDVTPEAEGTGASCVHQGDHICFPHLCDTRNNQSVVWMSFGCELVVNWLLLSLLFCCFFFFLFCFFGR